MTFTEWLESLTPFANLVHVLVGVLAGLGVVTVLLAYLKRITERRCWRNFKEAAYDWVNRIAELEDPRLSDLSDDEWRAVCERMLTDANFTPLEIQQLLGIAVVVTKGIAADKIFV